MTTSETNKKKCGQVSGRAARLPAELSAFPARPGFPLFLGPVVKMEPKCQRVWPLRVVREVTIDKLASEGLVGLEELSSSHLLLQREERKN